jgi:hypothetical protein
MAGPGRNLQKHFHAARSERPWRPPHRTTSSPSSDDRNSRQAIVRVNDVQQALRTVLPMQNASINGRTRDPLLARSGSLARVGWTPAFASRRKSDPAGIVTNSVRVQ